MLSHDLQLHSDDRSEIIHEGILVSFDGLLLSAYLTDRLLQRYWIKAHLVPQNGPYIPS